MKTIAALTLATLIFATTQADSLNPDATAGQIINATLGRRTVDSEVVRIRAAIYDAKDAASQTRRYEFAIISSTQESRLTRTIVVLTAPESVEGVALLFNALEGGHHLFLPVRGSAIGLRGQDLSGNFLGTDFTYEDLMREIPNATRFSRLGDQVVHGADCFVIRAESPSEDSQYDHRTLFIEKENLLVRKIDFYLTPTRIGKTLETYDHQSRLIKGTVSRPRYAVMTDHDSGSVSVFHTVDGVQGVDLDEAIFSAEGMRMLGAGIVSRLLDK